MANYKAIIQSVDYILKNGSCDFILDKLTILKLLFFAERYSLRKYAQSITGDEFVAMRCGPVASAAYDIISFKDTAKERDYTNEILSKIAPYFVKSNNALLMRDDYDELSDSDLEALDFALNEFGKYSSKKLVDITHNYKEWNRFKSKLETQDTSFKMDMNDFFIKTTENTKEYAVIPDEVVEINRDFYLGTPFDR